VSLAVLPSKAEPVAMWERDFSRFDKNKDGKLDVGEANFPENLPDRSECPDPQVCDAFIEASNNIARAVFSERDADGNGIVTRAEFQANYASRYGNWFDTLDEPGNLRGYITLESLMALPKGGRRMGLYLWAQAPGGDAELQNAISVWASDSAEPVPELVAARIGAEFSRHDLDKDGRVTRVEFLTGVAY
jgi:Ca2+-binding EF-hand superfamily protein